MKRFGSARWNGGLRDGKGAVSTESHAMKNYPYTFFSRYGESPVPTPKNYSARRTPRASPCRLLECLDRRTLCPSRVDSKSDVVIEKDGDGFSITSVHLTVTAKIPGIDHDTFRSIASRQRPAAPFPS